MKTELVLLKVKFGDLLDRHFNKRCFGSKLKKEVAARGGSCIARWAAETLAFAIQGIAPAQIAEIVEPFLDVARKSWRRLDVVQVEKEVSPRFKLPDASTCLANIRKEKLTKKLMFELPTGAFIVSNAYYPHFGSVFAQRLGPLESRDTAWKGAVATGTAQRLCQVLWTQDEFVRAAFLWPWLAL
jgi:hypothetical protein